MRKIVWLILAAAVLGIVGYAFAAPSPGPQHRGTLVHAIHANKDGVKVKTRRATDLIAQDIVFHPGDDSGWHYHPGVVLIQVDGAAGDSLVVQDNHCRTFMVPTGAAFHETGHKPGLVASPSTNTSDITVHIMYILPTGAPPRVNTDPPRCAQR
jgi:hypothetical protein